MSDNKVWDKEILKIKQRIRSLESAVEFFRGEKKSSSIWPCNFGGWDEAILDAERILIHLRLTWLWMCSMKISSGLYSEKEVRRRIRRAYAGRGAFC